MKRVLLVIGLVVSSIMFLIMLRGVLFISLDGIALLPIFGGLCYIFATKLIYRDEEIGSHIGWVLIVNGITFIVLPLCLPSLGVFGTPEIVISVVLLGSGAVLVVRGRRIRASERSRAVAGYNEAIELAPDSADAYYNRGDAYDEIGEYGKAIADYNRAIELDPNHTSAHYNRGCAYGEIGEYDKAILDYNKVIELNPRDVLAYYNRGRAYREKGKVPEAVSDLETCVELSTDPELTKDAKQALHGIRSASE